MAENPPAPLATWDHHERWPVAYGDTDTYRLGLEWLRPCSLIEDWGAGKGWAKTLVPHDQDYRAIDGSEGTFIDQVADLREYRSKVPGIFMRHVLEHNPDWQKILANAVDSFTERMALILFTPLVEETQELDFVPPGVPDLAFNLHDLTAHLPRWHHQTMDSPDTHYGTETIFYIER